MPSRPATKHRISLGDGTRARIAQLICQLVSAATPEQWRESSIVNPKLMVYYSKSSDFFAQFYEDQEKASGHWHNDRTILSDRLGILEDHRPQTRGIKYQHFTLSLWSKQPQKNVEKFNQLWQEKIKAIPPTIKHNLPNTSYSHFFGYELQQQQLTSLLSKPRSTPLITIDGLAGSGKTSLVIHVVTRLLASRQLPFQVIVFTSAQPAYCLPQKVVPRLQIDRHFIDILRQILITLNTLDLLPTELNALLASVQTALAAQPVLLIIDNIETTTDQDLLFAFLQELPTNVTTILTSRVKLGLGTLISLPGLDHRHSRQLIEHIATQKKLKITATQKKVIEQITGGIPLAINYILSCAALQNSIAALNLPELLLGKPQTPDSQAFTQYCFEDLIKQLRGKFTHRILLAISLFRHPISRPAALFVADLQNYPLQPIAALEELKYLNLIVEPETATYNTHSITRQYSRQELGYDPSYEQAYVDRWVDYYCQYTAPFGHSDWREWQDYNNLDQEWLNIRDVIEHCMYTDRLTDFTQLWQNLQGYTLLGGKWFDRLAWLEWWVKAANDQPEQLAPALYYQSQTLAHQNEADPTKETIRLAHQAWNCAEHLAASDFYQLRFDIALHLAPIHIRQAQVSAAALKLAQQWLQKAEESIDPQYSQEKIQWHQAQIMYYQAEIYHGNQQYDQAQQLYLKTNYLAKAIGFHRLSAYANSRVAVNAMHLQQLDDALHRFQQVLQAAIAHNDYRAIAVTQKYLALVQRDRQQIDQSRLFAQQAIQSFDRLLMHRESSEMVALLEQLK
jgi:Effector-associated domain 4/NB-ARC domain